jgi:hypothetical protein
MVWKLSSPFLTILYYFFQQVAEQYAFPFMLIFMGAPHLLHTPRFPVCTGADGVDGADDATDVALLLCSMRSIRPFLFMSMKNEIATVRMSSPVGSMLASLYAFFASARQLAIASTLD